MGQKKEIIEKLKISRQRLASLSDIIKDPQDAEARLISPPSRGRESVLMIEKDGIKYVSIKEIARIMGYSLETIYRKKRNETWKSVVYRGTTFVLYEPQKKVKAHSKESVLMIERGGIRYISVKKAAGIKKKSVKAVSQKVRDNTIKTVSYRGTIFVPEELYYGN